MKDTTHQTYTFQVHGMHCKACELMIEDELKEVPYVTSVKSDLKTHSVTVAGHFGDMTEKEASATLNKFIEKHNYTLSLEKHVATKNWSEFKIALPAALLFVLFFWGLQKMRIVNLVNAQSIDYGTAFVIGIIASLSTCMAVVGGLVLSMSATFAKEGDKVRPQLLFHVGRIVAFFILGGVIGAVGLVFTLNPLANFILNVVIGVAMIIMGVNLLDVFHSTKKLQFGMPKFLSKKALNVSKINHQLTPLLAGIATFFLPCGFTQSMQIFTLSTGSFLKGGFTMLSFAIGTLPILALVSFSSFSITDNSKKGIFFKSAGLVVIIFALFNLVNGLAAFGIISPLFNF
jgi:sulfite exporter TauE/SafE/copper chaperone CopZ